MTRTITALVACAAIVGCGDAAAPDDNRTLDALETALGVDFSEVGNQEPDLPSERMWDYTVPHDPTDPYPRGGRPMVLDPVPNDPTVWVVWQSMVVSSCGPDCAREGLLGTVQEVTADGDGFPDAFRLKIDPAEPPPTIAQNSEPRVVGVEPGTPALAMGVVIYPTDEMRARFSHGDTHHELSMIWEEDRLGESDHFLIWLADDVPRLSPAGHRFNSALPAGYHLVPRFRDRRLDCVERPVDEGCGDAEILGSCGDPELQWLPILDLEDDVGVFTGDWRPLGQLTGSSPDPI